MAYNKEKLLKEIKEAITENNLYFIEDISAFVGCSKVTVYDLFPIESNEMNDIKELLNNNKITTKVKLRKKLADGDKASEIISLYKLIGTQEERKALSQNYTDHTTGGKEMNTEPVVINFRKKKRKVEVNGN